MLPIAAQWVGEGQILYASDYPHWDSDWPHTVKHFLDRDDISDTDKRTILGENPQRLYGFTANVPSPVGSA
jgi:predicted TIM-barrel fold metal-dependent hydrolase